MADKARQWTDKQLDKMEKHLNSIYTETQKGITEKWDKYMRESGEELKKLQAEYDEAKKSGDKEAMKNAGRKLSKAKKSQTIQNRQYQSMVDGITTQLANVNQTAVAYLNGQLPSIYTVNYNAVNTTATEAGIAFNIVNENTVKKLIEDGDIKLPYKNLDKIKDKRWNTKQLNSSVLQGILQGDSMDKIADRILPIVDNNKNAAIRNARTMVTGAENAGRLDSYKDLDERGAVQKKVWIAAADNRVRDWHLSMDGQEVDLDDDFIDGKGNRLEYPGDPDGEPETVYNCRCSMATRIIGFRKPNGRIEYLTQRDKSGLHEQQIAEEKKRRAK